ncbi:SCO7613 C-terminal domain-containing membrane protein [Actinoplanes sp. NPDC051859]|uniref:SCO7613 C-terminal domain-containing membrane protein n=1 Tax=Actinoplanes sp. NPDC051859 TaxID=3363909 RepID=UPI0037AAA331
MTAYPCPFCRTEASLAAGCPGCGRGPDPDAAEVVRLDVEIPVLASRLTAAREAVSVADLALRRAWNSRETAAARVRESVRTAAKTAPRPAAAPAMTAPVTTATAEATSRLVTEASTKLVQNTLFSLGGLLLAVAAIVFTAVAWSQFGMKGRASLLAVVTVVALTAPLVALRRKLTATAETFAAVGLLLVLLDGYAAWYVNLFGVADYSALGYAGAVCAVTAAIAAGYEHVTGLTGPRFAALLVAQPVLPLLVAPFHPDPAGWAFTFSAVALVDLAVVHLRPGRLTVVGITAYALGAVAAALGGLIALTALVVADTTGEAALAAPALVTAALVVLAGAWGSPWQAPRVVAGALVAVATVVAGAQFAAVAGGARTAPVWAALIMTVTAVVVRLLPATVRLGPRIGVYVLLTPVALAVLLATVSAAFTRDADWRLPVVIAVLTVGAAALLPLLPVTLTGAALLALAAPAGFGLPWWSAVPLDLLVAVAALIIAARSDRWTVGFTALLTGHAVIVSWDRPGVAALTLAAVAGIAMATVWRGPQDIGGVALAVAVPAVPPALWQAVTELGGSPAVQSRVALAATAALVAAVLLIARHRVWSAAALLIVLATTPVWALASGDSPAAYAALALIGAAATLRVLDGARQWMTAAAGAILSFAYLAGVTHSLVTLFLGPVLHIGTRWSGPVAWADMAATALVATAVALAALLLRGPRAALWLAAPVASVAVVLAVAALRVPWPGVPAAALLTALVGLVVAALHGTVRRSAGLVPVAAGLLAAALAGALATHAATLAAFGATLVAGAVVGSGGRAAGPRIAGWLGAAGSALVLAYTAGNAASLPVERTGFIVLATAAAVLAAGVFLVRRPDESRLVQAAAHAGAVVALLLTSDAIRYAAAVCTLWGLVLGLRALVRGAGGRRAHVVAAAGAELGAWWLLLASAEVAVVEAYTIPLAVVALLAGWLTRRRTPVSSWLAYGPALAAALLPTLATVLTGEGEPLRRLLLGVAALAVVVAGAQFRLQAPVVTGGAVLVLVALHEAARVWDLVPRWIPLAAAGLLLVGLAMTLERRRRDLARFRAALTRMG